MNGLEWVIKECETIDEWETKLMKKLAYNKRVGQGGLMEYYRREQRKLDGVQRTMTWLHRRGDDYNHLEEEYTKRYTNMVRALDLMERDEI